MIVILLILWAFTELFTAMVKFLSVWSTWLVIEKGYHFITCKFQLLILYIALDYVHFVVTLKAAIYLLQIKAKRVWQNYHLKPGMCINYSPLSFPSPPRCNHPCNGYIYVLSLQTSTLELTPFLKYYIH